MWTRFALALGVMAAGALGCSRDGDDPPADVGDPTALGRTLTLQQLQDPGSKDALKIDPPASCAVPFSTPITLDGVSVNWVDRYDETNDGALGTIWIQDYQTTAPWSGSSIFSPSFVPSSLYVAEGDLIDLRGLYEVNICLGSTVDFTGKGQLGQIATPTATFRFDGAKTEPVDVDPTDFNSFETGRKWIGMLVRFKDVSVSSDPSPPSDGRVSVTLDQAPAIPLSNEFQDISSIKRGKKYASVTGVVTWFFTFKLATRMPEDIVEAAAP